MGQEGVTEGRGSLWQSSSVKNVDEVEDRVEDKQKLQQIQACLQLSDWLCAGSRRGAAQVPFSKPPNTGSSSCPGWYAAGTDSSTSLPAGQGGNGVDNNGVDQRHCCLGPALLPKKRSATPPPSGGSDACF